MTITSTQYQKNNPNRISLFVDEKYSFSVHVDLLIKYDLRKGKEISQEEIDSIKIIDIKNRVYDRTVNYLNRGLKSEYQLRNYIKKLLYEKLGDWYEEDDQVNIELVVEQTIEKLTSTGYVNDQNFAYAYARSIVERKAVSRYYLSGKLREKGIDPKLSDQVTNELLIDESEQVKKALLKKYRTVEIEKGDQKKIAYLQRKGFNWDVISKFIIQ